MSRIDDFGEKIQGARKDAHQQWVDSVNQGVSDGKAGFIGSPLSKSWPAPNYERMTREGGAIPKAVVDWMRSARDQLGTKPGQYRVNVWATKASIYLSTAHTLMNRDWGHEPSLEEVGDIAAHLIEDATFDHQISGFNKSIIMDEIGSIHARSLCYAQWGHGNSLRFISFSKLETNASNDSQKTHIFSARVTQSAQSVGRRYNAKSWSGLVQELATDSYIAGLIDNESNDKKQTSTVKRKDVKLSIIGYRGKPERSVAVKVRSEWVELEKFANASEAREAFMDLSRHEKWQANFAQWRQLARARTRGNKNLPREGMDWREGEDISAEDFSDTFGFRGVQFGNYVGNERRQDDLNNAYDALMDMASVLDIAPSALSLDGTLGLAFGARGRGGLNPASAHYEPDHKVINLTKTNGAGSLAHEWFHAFDNYIADTTLPTPDHGHAHTYFSHALIRNPQSHRQYEGLEENNPISESLKGVVDLLYTRSLEMDKRRSGQPYWSQNIEIAARSFEAGIKEALSQQGVRNDYLVNILDEELWEGVPKEDMSSLLAAPSYPYPKEDEKAENAKLILTAVEAMCARSPAFDDRFNQIEGSQHQDKSHSSSSVGEQLSFSM